MSRQEKLDAFVQRRLEALHSQDPQQLNATYLKHHRMDEEFADWLRPQWDAPLMGAVQVEVLEENLDWKKWPWYPHLLWLRKPNFTMKLRDNNGERRWPVAFHHEEVSGICLPIDHDGLVMEQVRRLTTKAGPPRASDVVVPAPRVLKEVRWTDPANELARTLVLGIARIRTRGPIDRFALDCHPWFGSFNAGVRYVGEEGENSADWQHGGVLESKSHSWREARSVAQWMRDQPIETQQEMFSGFVLRALERPEVLNAIRTLPRADGFELVLYHPDDSSYSNLAYEVSSWLKEE